MQNKMEIQYIGVDEITAYSRNAKKHPAEQVEHIANSIREFGFRQPLVIDRDGVLVIGHGRLLAAKKLGLETVPCVRADDLTDEQIKALRLADNKTNESPWDFSALEEELAELDEMFEMADFGFIDDVPGYDASGIDSGEEGDSADSENEIERNGEAKGSLAERYLVPPFSVIYANKPDWLARKRAWVAKGLHSEIGRGGDLLTIQGAIQRQTSYIRRIGGGERSKAFKNNSRLNSYMTGRKPSPQTQSQG